MPTIPLVSDGSFRRLADADEKTGVLNGKQRCENEEEDPARFSMEVDMTPNDPGHPQQPPDGPCPSHGQKQPPYGKPHYGDAPGTDPLAPQQPRKKGRRWLPILITVLVLISCASSAYPYISSVLHDPVPGIVNQYYTAIKNQDYATAYMYLGVHQWTSGVTSNPERGVAGGWGFPGGQDFMTQSDFTQAAQYADTTQGKVRTFTIEDTMRPLDSSGIYTATASVSVTRNGAPYYVNLNLEQIEGEDWKIIGFDDL